MGSPTDAPITRNISGYPSFAADWATHPTRPTHGIYVRYNSSKCFGFTALSFIAGSLLFQMRKALTKLTILMTTHAKYSNFQRTQKWTEGRCEGKEVKRPKSF